MVVNEGLSLYPLLQLAPTQLLFSRVPGSVDRSSLIQTSSRDDICIFLAV